MATKDNYLSFKEKQTACVESDNQYNNLSLNQNYQCSVNDTPCLKSFKTDSKNGQNNDLSHLNDFVLKKDSNSWNKSNKHFPTTFLNLNDGFEERDKFKKAKNANNSTLSLHIAAYENSIEATNESDACEKEVKYMVKKWGTSNHIIGSITFIQNPFEFPRQQENEANRPEVMQFVASQTLLNPNQMAANNQVKSPEAKMAEAEVIKSDEVAAEDEKPQEEQQQEPTTQVSPQEEEDDPVREISDKIEKSRFAIKEAEYETKFADRYEDANFKLKENMPEPFIWVNMPTKNVRNDRYRPRDNDRNRFHQNDRNYSRGDDRNRSRGDDRNRFHHNDRNQSRYDNRRGRNNDDYNRDRESRDRQPRGRY